MILKGKLRACKQHVDRRTVAPPGASAVKSIRPFVSSSCLYARAAGPSLNDDIVVVKSTAIVRHRAGNVVAPFRSTNGRATMKGARRRASEMFRNGSHRRQLPFPPMPDLPALDCWYLTGATASGKTSVGLELAERLGAEIISLGLDGHLSRHGCGHRQADRGPVPPDAASLDRRGEPRRGVQPLAICRRRTCQGCRNSSARPRSTLRRRYAALFEIAAARHLRGSAGRLGISPAGRRRSRNGRHRCATPAAGPGRSDFGSQAASQ